MLVASASAPRAMPLIAPPTWAASELADTTVARWALVDGAVDHAVVHRPGRAVHPVRAEVGADQPGRAGRQAHRRARSRRGPGAARTRRRRRRTGARGTARIAAPSADSTHAAVIAGPSRRAAASAPPAVSSRRAGNSVSKASIPKPQSSSPTTSAISRWLARISRTAPRDHGRHVAHRAPVADASRAPRRLVHQRRARRARRRPGRRGRARAGRRGRRCRGTRRCRRWPRRAARRGRSPSR